MHDIEDALDRISALAKILYQATHHACETSIEGHEDMLLDGHSVLEDLIKATQALQSLNIIAPPLAVAIDEAHPKPA